MRIEITSEGRSFKLIIPTGLILNPVVFTVTKGAIRVEGLDLSAIKAKDVSAIAKIIKKCKKQDPDWCLVDVEEASGDRVKIKL